jgi:hypothetical protein
MKKKSMREDMPQTSAFIDALRTAFGKEMIDGQIRKGISGQATFYACENGHVVGTPVLKSTKAPGISGKSNTSEVNGSGE